MRVVCSLTVSLDGFAALPDGDLSWGAPTPDVFRYATDEVRAVGVHVLGRRLFEVMRWWDDDQDGWDDDERVFAQLWRALPKVVVSRTLTGVPEGYRLTGDLLGEVARLRAQEGDGVVAVGGPSLARQVAEAGLLDGYRLRVAPVLLGGGTPLFPAERRQLALRESRTFAGGTTALVLDVV